MQLGTVKELVRRSIPSVWISNWRLERKGEERLGYLMQWLTSLLQYNHITYLWINKELSLTIMQCDIYKRFCRRLQKHLFFPLNSQKTTFCNYGGKWSDYYRHHILINLYSKFSEVQRLGLHKHCTHSHPTLCAVNLGMSKCSNFTCSQHFHLHFWIWMYFSDSALEICLYDIQGLHLWTFIRFLIFSSVNS